MQETTPKPLESDTMVEIEAILEKYDPEARYLKLTGHWVTLIRIIAVCFSLFQLYTAMFGLLEAQIQRPTHLMFALTLIYLLYPTKKPKKNAGSSGLQINPVDLILSILSITVASYSLFTYQNLMESAGLYSTTDYIMAVLGILLTLEATRRIVGLPIVIIASCFL
ncbi:MAG: hypothetical protein Q8M56_11095, partial [Desulfobacterales bacterium]|nr:hypothetical protein [Desulfobacterales bacterium]